MHLSFACNTISRGGGQNQHIMLYDKSRFSALIPCWKMVPARLVVHERTWGGRLFQTVGATARKARELNDKLDRTTDKTLADRTLAEANCKVLHGLWRWSKLARYYGGLPVSVAILNLIQASMGSQWSLFRVDAGVSKASTCDNTCIGILCALETRDVFSWNGI